MVLAKNKRFTAGPLTKACVHSRGARANHWSDARSLIAHTYVGKLLADPSLIVNRELWAVCRSLLRSSVANAHATMNASANRNR